MVATEHAKNTSAAAANHEAKIWLGLVVGIAVGIGISLSRKGKSRRDAAHTPSDRVTGRVTEPPAGFAGEFADTTPELAAQAPHVSRESRKMMESAKQLWASGRKLAGY